MAVLLPLELDGEMPGGLVCKTVVGAVLPTGLGQPGARRLIERIDLQQFFPERYRFGELVIAVMKLGQHGVGLCFHRMRLDDIAKVLPCLFLPVPPDQGRDSFISRGEGDGCVHRWLDYPAGNPLLQVWTGDAPWVRGGRLGTFGVDGGTRPGDPGVQFGRPSGKGGWFVPTGIGRGLVKVQEDEGGQDDCHRGHQPDQRCGGVVLSSHDNAPKTVPFLKCNRDRRPVNSGHYGQ